MTDVASAGEHFRPRRSTAQYCSPSYRKASVRSRAVSVPRNSRRAVRRPCVPARLQDGAGGDCLEAAGIALSIGPVAGLAQVQESGCSGGEARGGRGLGSVTIGLAGRLQGGIAQPPRVTLTSLRKLYDLLGNGFTCRTDDPVGMLEGHKGHLKSQAQETSRLGIKPMALQVCCLIGMGAMLIQP